MILFDDSEKGNQLCLTHYLTEVHLMMWSEKRPLPSFTNSFG